ncbi:MAG: MlaD family protein [Segniliparus sp.]|uniref:MlaD family protein n=1 Tax=Segniliparus sp. TaxID=2804064 RepID=UPI003F3BDE03
MKLRLNVGTTLLLLLAIALLGAGYMSVGVLHMGAVKKTTHVTLLLKKSGGLMPTSDVTMRGIRVGQVASVRTTAAGLSVTLELDSSQRVPQNSAVGVETLSIAGEQYIDFKPLKIAPPYLEEGAVIPASQAIYHATVGEMLERSNELFSAFDPKDLKTILDNIAAIFHGSDKMFDQLASDSAVYARMIQENKQLFEVLFGNVDFINTNLGKINAGGVLTGMSKQLSPDVLDSLDRWFQQVHLLRDYVIAHEVFTPDNTLETLAAKLGEYLDLLSGPMATFAPALESATAPLYNDRIDVGGWIGQWGSAMEDNGGIKVRVHVKGQPQPQDRQAHDEPQTQEDQPHS